MNQSLKSQLWELGLQQEIKPPGEAPRYVLRVTLSNFFDIGRVFGLTWPTLQEARDFFQNRRPPRVIGVSAGDPTGASGFSVTFYADAFDEPVEKPNWPAVEAAEFRRTSDDLL